MAKEKPVLDNKGNVITVNDIIQITTNLGTPSVLGLLGIVESILENGSCVMRITCCSIYLNGTRDNKKVVDPEDITVRGHADWCDTK